MGFVLQLPETPASLPSSVESTQMMKRQWERVLASFIGVSWSFGPLFGWFKQKTDVLHLFYVCSTCIAFPGDWHQETTYIAQWRSIEELNFHVGRIEKQSVSVKEMIWTWTRPKKGLKVSFLNHVMSKSKLVLSNVCLEPRQTYLHPQHLKTSYEVLHKTDSKQKTWFTLAYKSKHLKHTLKQKHWWSQALQTKTPRTQWNNLSPPFTPPPLDWCHRGRANSKHPGQFEVVSGRENGSNKAVVSWLCLGPLLAC